MLELNQLGAQISAARRRQGMRQIDLAAAAGLSRATIDALENGRAPDVGFSKLSRTLSALGLELAIRPAGGRPTLDELLIENADD